MQVKAKTLLHDISTGPALRALLTICCFLPMLCLRLHKP